MKVRAAPRETILALAPFLLTNILQRHGFPNVIFTDKAPYTGARFQEEYHWWRRQYPTSVLYYPKRIVLDELIIGTLKRSIKCIVDGDLIYWEEYLERTVMNQRTLPYKSSKGRPLCQTQKWVNSYNKRVLKKRD